MFENLNRQYEEVENGLAEFGLTLKPGEDATVSSSGMMTEKSGIPTLETLPTF